MRGSADGQKSDKPDQKAPTLSIIKDWFMNLVPDANLLPSSDVVIFAFSIERFLLLFLLEVWMEFK